MPNKTVNWQNIDAYAIQDSEYSNEARQLLAKEIGFEPDLRASRVTEIKMRHSLKRLDEGKLTQDQVDYHIKAYANVIKRIILKDIPEQAHLIDKDEVENFKNL